MKPRRFDTIRAGGVLHYTKKRGLVKRMQKARRIYEHSRILSQEEMQQVIHQQRCLIESLRAENGRLQQQAQALEPETGRGAPVRLPGMTQKSAEETLYRARSEAEGIVEEARRQAQKRLRELDGYIRRILETEDTVRGLLGMLRRFEEQMLRADEDRPPCDFSVSVRACAAGRE